MEIADSWFGKLSRRSMLTRTLLLSGILLILFLMLTPIVLMQFGSIGMLSLSLAATATLFTGVLCLGIGSLATGESGPLAQMALGMGIRLGILLGLCFAADRHAPELMSAGFLLWCLVFYMVGLTAETAILVCNLSTGVEKVS